MFLGNINKPGGIKMTEVHFTMNLDEIQNLIDVEVKDNISKSILTKVFNQLMEK